MDEGRKATKRPSAITIIATLCFLWAGVMIFLGLMLILLPGRTNRGASLAGVIFLLIAVAGIFAGVGLWKLKNWARILVIVLAGLGAPFALIGTLTTPPPTNLIALILDCAILWYVYRPDVKEAFRCHQVRALIGGTHSSTHRDIIEGFPQKLTEAPPKLSK